MAKVTPVPGAGDQAPRNGMLRTQTKLLLGVRSMAGPI